MTPTAIQEQIKKHFKFLPVRIAKPTQTKESLLALEADGMAGKEKPKKASRRSKR